MADERSENLLHELFFRSAKNFPDNIAVTFSGSAVELVTYHDLCKKVEDLSTYFKKLFFRNEVVGIYARDCLNMPALLLAVMDASAAFYPLSTEIQPRKVLENLSHHSIRHILVENSLVHNITNTIENVTLETPLEIVDSGLLHAVQFTMLKVANRNENCVVKWSKNLAYVMQTSGTTGDPKAVFVPHSCIVPNITHLSSIFDVTCHDVVYLSSPYTFDPSIIQMFLAFHNGAELLITPRETRLIPEKLCQKLFDQHQITIFQPTPALLYYIGSDIVTTKVLSENSTLSVLAIGGESCPSLLTLRKWKHSKCKTRLYNIYGITEVSSWATCHHITEDDLCVAVDDSHESGVFSACPLGTPLSQTELIVCNNNGDVISGDGVGHLWIGGHDRQCLLEGETEENVPVMRDSGDIVQVKDRHMWFLGRSDNQVKRFGYRINLDHIEKVVCEYAEVTSCSLVLAPTSTGGKLLHLYAVPKLLEDNLSRDLEKCKQDIWKRIKEVLPRESQPNEVHVVWKLPLTHHGKVDKRELLRITEDTDSQHEDDQSVVAKLSKMWIECTGQNISSAVVDEDMSSRCDKNSLKTPLSVLGPPNLSVKADDMFMLQGGDSFRAVQFAEQIEKWICQHSSEPVVELSTLFEIITNKPFVHLVSYVEESLQSGKLENNQSTELDQLDVGFNKDGKHTTKADIEFAAKMSKPDTDLTNKDDHKPLFKKENFRMESEVQVCTCYARRGSERFACSMCEDTSKCLLFHYEEPRSSGEEMSSLQNVSWKWSVFMEKCIDASPLVVPSCLSSDGAVFIGSHSNLFLSVSLSNGEVLWRTRLGGRIESSACLSLCGRLIVVGCYDGKVYALARNNGQIAWTYQTQDVIKSSPCTDKKTGLIWVGSHDGCLYGLDIDRKICIKRVECGEGSCFSSPTISYNPHHVYIATLAGCFICVDAVSGETKWLKRLEKPIFCSPLTQSDSVFVATVNGYLKCFNHFGEEVWEFRTNDQVFSSPLGCTSQVDSVTGDVILTSHGLKVYRISSKGECRWSTSVDGPVYATPCFVCSGLGFPLEEEQEISQQARRFRCGCIVVATIKGTLYFMASSDGRIIKKFSLNSEIFSSPVVFCRDIVIGCRNDYLHCINLT